MIGSAPDRPQNAVRTPQPSFGPLIPSWPRLRKADRNARTAEVVTTRPAPGSTLLRSHQSRCRELRWPGPRIPVASATCEDRIECRPKIRRTGDAFGSLRSPTTVDAKVFSRLRAAHRVNQAASALLTQVVSLLLQTLPPSVLFRIAPRDLAKFPRPFLPRVPAANPIPEGIVESRL